MRTPREIIRHMTRVLRAANRCFFPEFSVDAPEPLPFTDEVRRFHDILQQIDDNICAFNATDDGMFKAALQGPLSDAMTHVGQIAMLRRMFGNPISGQNFMAAEIKAGNLGTEQPEPRQPFDDTSPQ